MEEIFNYLPDELLYKIMYMLNYENLIYFCKTDIRARNLCQNSTFWRNKIDIIAPGRSDNLINKSLKIIKDIYRNIEKAGYLYMFGNNVNGELGLNHNNDISIPTLVSNFDNVVQISCGFMHTAFLTNQGDIYTFGYNGNGQLGHGDTITRNIPSKIKLDCSIRVKQVSCGFFHTAFITDIGNIYTCGYNNSGQLGLGNYFDASIPIQIPGFNNVLQVSCGHSYTAFITEKGNIYTFGSQYTAQDGPQNRIGSSIPVQILGFDDIVQVSCGYSHTVFLTAEGKVYAFGATMEGQLGILGSGERVSLPVKISLINNGIQISCGFETAAFVTKNGNVHSVGDNTKAQLGLGDDRGRIVPILITIKDQPLKFTQVSCGKYHTAFLTDRGEIYICGGNSFGELGLGLPLENKSEPHKIHNFVDITHISCGYYFTGFIKLKS